MSSKGDAPLEEESKQQQEGSDSPPTLPESASVQEGAEEGQNLDNGGNNVEEQPRDDIQNSDLNAGTSTSEEEKPPRAKHVSRLAAQRGFKRKVKRISWPPPSRVQKHSQEETSEGSEPQSLDVDVSPRDDINFSFGESEENAPSEAASNVDITKGAKSKPVSNEPDFCEPGTSTGITERTSIEYYAKSFSNYAWLRHCRAHIESLANWSGAADSSSMEDIPKQAESRDQPRPLPTHVSRPQQRTRTSPGKARAPGRRGRRAGAAKSSEMKKFLDEIDLNRPTTSTESGRLMPKEYYKTKYSFDDWIIRSRAVLDRRARENVASRQTELPRDEPKPSFEELASWHPFEQKQQEEVPEGPIKLSDVQRFFEQYNAGKFDPTNGNVDAKGSSQVDTSTGAISRTSRQSYPHSVSFDDWIRRNRGQTGADPHVVVKGEPGSQEDDSKSLQARSKSLLDDLAFEEYLFDESELNSTSDESNLHDEACAKLETKSDAKKTSNEGNSGKESAPTAATAEVEEEIHATMVTYDEWLRHTKKTFAEANIKPPFPLESSSIEDLARGRPGSSRGRERQRPSAEMVQPRRSPYSLYERQRAYCAVAEQYYSELRNKGKVSCQTEVAMRIQTMLTQHLMDQVRENIRGGPGPRGRQNYRGRGQFNRGRGQYNRGWASGRGENRRGRRGFYGGPGIRGRRGFYAEYTARGESGLPAEPSTSRATGFQGEASSRGRRSPRASGGRGRFEGARRRYSSYDDSSTSDDKNGGKQPDVPPK